MPNSDALIGYTGFVGGNILNQHQFDFLYNSKNIEDIGGKNFDSVVCAGAPAVKWLANKEPENDLATIERLINNLKKISTKKFILISTVDVYPQTSHVDEDFIIQKEHLPPYGKHRRILEEFIEERFDSLIVRLPGLFGPGLKKNPLYDLMQGNLEYINPESILQFYYLNYLWRDINTSLENDLKIINLVSEPIFLSEIAEKILHVNIPKKNIVLQAYNIQSKHAALWGNSTPYLYQKDKTLADIAAFVDSK